MPRVPVTTYSRPPTGVGGALSALGGSMVDISGLLQQSNEREKKEKLSKLVAEKLKKQQDRQNSSNLLSEPGELSTFETSKFKPETGQNVSVESAFAMEPEIDAGGGVPRGATERTPSMPTPQPAQSQSALSSQQPQQQAGINPAFEAQAWEMGREQFRQSVPPDVYEEALNDYREVAQAAAEAGDPTFAYSFFKDQLNFYKNEYNAKTDMLELIQKYNLIARNEAAALPGKKELKAISPPAKPRPGAKTEADRNMDSLQKELATIKGTISTLDSTIVKEKNAFTREAPEKKAARIQELTNRLSQANERQTMIQKQIDAIRSGGGTSSGGTQAAGGDVQLTPEQQIDMQRRIAAYKAQGLSQEDAARQVEAEFHQGL